MKEFSLGAVVVPAYDGTLKHLGHSVRDLGERALGFVLESRSSKALVQFPDMRLSLWLDHAELADVSARVREGDAAFESLKPVGGSDLRVRNLSWIVEHLVALFGAKFVLGCEQGDTLASLWTDPYLKITDFYQGPTDIRAAYLALGLPELTLADWRAAEAYLGDELLFARFLPAGMHKLELALYLRR